MALKSYEELESVIHQLRSKEPEIEIEETNEKIKIPFRALQLLSDILKAMSEGKPISKDYMIHSVRFKAVLDTNVIYQVIIRDLLFWFVYYDLYTPKWRNIFLMNGKACLNEKVYQKTKLEKEYKRQIKLFPVH